MAAKQNTNDQTKTTGHNRPNADLMIVRQDDDKAYWTRLFAGWKNKDGKGYGLLPHGHFEVRTVQTDGGEGKVMELVSEHGNQVVRTCIGRFIAEQGNETFIFDGDLVLRERRESR